MAHTHTLWSDVEEEHLKHVARYRSAGGRPPSAQPQRVEAPPQRVGDNEQPMSEKEHAQQLEKQLELRERRRQAQLKAQEKEEQMMLQLAERQAGLEWNHMQRERSAKGLTDRQRKQAQMRLYTPTPKRPATGRVYG